MALPYRADLKKLAAELRNHSTLGEVLLWKQLKGRQRRGFDFHRQRPIGNYIVDFYAPLLRLAVEVDGRTHDFKVDADVRRREQLKAMGVEMLTFGEHEVRRDAVAVAALIDQWIDENLERARTR